MKALATIPFCFCLILFIFPNAYAEDEGIYLNEYELQQLLYALPQDPQPAPPQEPQDPQPEPPAKCCHVRCVQGGEFSETVLKSYKDRSLDEEACKGRREDPCSVRDSITGSRQNGNYKTSWKECS